MNGAWRRILALALTVGVAAALRAQTYNISDYFPLAHDSEWYLVDAGPMPEGDTDAFRWEVLPDELALPGGLFARKLQTTTDEESDDRNHDIDYWRHNPNGNLEMWGSYVNDFPTGPYNLVLGAPLIAGTNGMTVGTQIDSTQPYSFGFGIPLTVALNTTLVAALPSVDTPRGTFADVITLRMGFEIRDIPGVGTYSVFDNYVYLARGVGMVWQTQKADTDDATDQKLASGMVAGVPIAPTGPTSSTVGGTVTDGTNPLPGVTVSLGGGLQATSGADGTYTIAEVPAGDYTATPALAGYTFDPASRSVTVPPAAAAVDFVGTAVPVGHEIGGRVTLGAAGLGGITVTLAGVGTRVTAGDGSYAFTNVPDGEYRVFPTPTDAYVFTPPQRLVAVPPNQTADFVAQAVGDGSLVPGSTAIYLAGRDDIPAIPDLGVDPAAVGFPLGRNCTEPPIEGYVKEVFPLLFGVSPGETLTFTAAGGVDYYGGTEPSVGPDGDPDYPAAISNLDGISGYSGPAGALVGVFLDDANPQGGTPPATLDFSAAGLGTAFASLAPDLGQVFFIGDGSNGGRAAQTFTAPAGATRLFLGIADAFGFGGAPGAYDDNIGAFVVTVTRGTYSVSGTVTDGTDPLPGVTVSLGGGLQATSGADGAYTIAEVPAGDYTATPALAGYTFDPASRSVTVPPAAAAVDFVGTAVPVGHEIGGRVTLGAAGLGGITVTLAGVGTRVTAGDGSYAFTNVPDGEYRVFPTPTDAYVFTPPQRLVAVPPNQTADFVAQAVGDGSLVPGSTAIYLAGRDDIPAIPDLGVDPAAVGFPLGRNCTEPPIEGYVKEVFPAQFAVSPGETLTFAAGGGVDYYGGTEPSVGPDGDPDYPAAISNLDGISGYSGPAGALVGVFLDDANPQGGTPPATLDFSAAGLGTAFASLAPDLGQVFFIGDGSNGGRAAQTFTAPAGTTRLFLGIADAFGFGGAPGAYDDNIGAFVVSVTRLPAPNTYTVTFAHTPGGTLDGDPEQTVAAGAHCDPVQANPAGGQHFVHWLDGLGAVYSTANPLTVKAVAANLALTAVFAANTPDDPQGEFDLQFASPANPDGRRLWDVSGGPYVFAAGSFVVSVTIAQDLRGVLEGTGELTGDLHGTQITVPLRVRGRVRGTNGTVVARLRFAGAAQNVVARGNAVLTVNAPNLSGPVTVSVTSRTLGNDTATELCAVALPAQMDGLYDLTVTLGLAGGRITGTGLLTLSNDRSVPLTIRGRVGTSGSSVRLTGNSRLEPAATAVRLGGIIATYTDGTGTIQSLQGQGFGQRIRWP